MKPTICRIPAWGAMSLVAISLFSILAAGQQPATQIRTPRQTPLPPNPDFSKLEIQTLKVQGRIYLLAGGGGNITAQVGDEGVLLVDTGFEKMADKSMAAIRKLSD